MIAEGRVKRLLQEKGVNKAGEAPMVVDLPSEPTFVDVRFGKVQGSKFLTLKEIEKRTFKKLASETTDDETMTFTKVYGGSGSFGFKTTRVLDRFFDYGHSDFFTDEHFKTFWQPYILTGQVVASPWDSKRPTPPWLLLVLGSIPMVKGLLLLTFGLLGYRVSTQRQGASGLGLEAQRQTVAQYLSGAHRTTVGEFLEVETGKGADPLSRRPQLRLALDLCKRTGATLLIAKLDRLARNVHFVSGLMGSKVTQRTLQIRCHRLPDRRVMPYGPSYPCRRCAVLQSAEIRRIQRSISCDGEWPQ